MPVNPVKSWSSTLRLPKSTFPPRPSLPHQTQYLQKCTGDLYKWQSEQRSTQEPFVLGDGPPYANGSLHVGHALNKILKDIICRVKIQQGRRVIFNPGWDCHGLPIEVKALEKHREEKMANGEGPLDSIGIRRAARTLANKTVKAQMNGFRSWGIMGDWDRAWRTMDQSFELKQLSVFQSMVEKNLIFRRFKPVYWSPSSKSALAEAELEYKEDHESTAAFVSFRLTSLSEYLKKLEAEHSLNKLAVIIWTTTPWTLPANRAIAFHKDMEYSIVRSNCLDYIVAKSQVESLTKVNSNGLDGSCPPKDPKIIVDSLQGSYLEGCEYINSLRGKPEESIPQPLIHADFVSSGSGSGLVHCAPGHGMDDYEVCTRLGIEAVAPVDDLGCFTAEAFPKDPKVLQGRSVLEDGSMKVLKLIHNQVLAVQKYKHKYPYDWRTKLPVIVRATEQWFADVGSIKDDALQRLEHVRFIPESGRARLESFVKGRSEWCISRQRAWGVPIPALYDEYGNAVLSAASVAHIIGLIKKRGTDAWWTDDPHDPAWILPGLQGVFTRGTDTMDVWFDSGTSWANTEKQADVCLEGTDQHRGWFQSSLLTHTAASPSGSAPYKTVITHGFTLDQDGKKMSKSLGNVIAPSQIMDGSLLPPLPIKKKKGIVNKIATTHDGFGADALRLWVASSDYTRDVVIGEPALKSINHSLLKYRTTLKMLLGSMHASARTAPLTKFDRIALVQLDDCMKDVAAAYDNFEFYKGIKAIDRWLFTDVSAFYLEGMKDRLYCGDGGGVLEEIFQGLLRMLSPIMPGTVEEAWDHRPQWMLADPLKHPLHQTAEDRIIPASLSTHIRDQIRADVPWLLNAKAAINTAIEAARQAKLVGSSLQSTVVLVLPEEPSMELFQYYGVEELEAILVVSSIELAAKWDGRDVNAEWSYSAEFEAPGGKGIVWVLPPGSAKCPRCWKYVAASEDELCVRCEEVVAESSTVGAAAF